MSCYSHLRGDDGNAELGQRSDMTRPRPGRGLSVRMLAAYTCVEFYTGSASAQLLNRYFPANVPAYQDWFATASSPSEVDEYSPLGIRMGSFTVLPTVTGGVGYDSNIFGVASGGGSPEALTTAAVSVNSDWSRNSLDAAATINDTRYINFPNRSYTEWTASLGAAIDVGNSEIRAGYSHLNTVSLPTDAGLFGLTVPVTNSVDDFRVSDTVGTGPLIFVPAIRAQLYEFTTMSEAEAASSLDLFNRQAITTSITTGYEFAAGHNAIVVLSDSQVGYDSDGFQPRPADYNDRSILAGLEYRASGVLSYRALVGFEERSATGKGTNSTTIDAPAAELDMIWSPNALTSVTGEVTQSLEDESTGNAQGLKETSLNVVLQYAWRRNVNLRASVQYTNANFAASNNTQTTASVTAGATWRISHYWSVAADYEFTKGCDSTSSALQFTRNQAVLRLKLDM